MDYFEISNPNINSIEINIITIAITTTIIILNYYINTGTMITKKKTMKTTQIPFKKNIFNIINQKDNTLTEDDNLEGK